jgi:hypothetical protein
VESIGSMFSSLSSAAETFLPIGYRFDHSNATSLLPTSCNTLRMKIAWRARTALGARHHLYRHRAALTRNCKDIHPVACAMFSASALKLVTMTIGATLLGAYFI